MEPEMDMNEAVDNAVDLATTMDTGDPVPETEPAPKEAQPKPETEAPAETPTEEAPAKDAADDGDLAQRLAEMTADEVAETTAGKGLYAQLHREREKRQQLETELEALKTAQPDEDEYDGADDDADIFTVGDVNKAIDRRLAAAAKPAADVASITQVMATGLAALKADKSIPTGLNVGTVVEDAIKALKTSRPGTLNDLLSEPDPVRAVWEYATARMPEAKQALAAATKAKADVDAERLAKGRDPATGDEAQNMETLLADLNG